MKITKFGSRDGVVSFEPDLSAARESRPWDSPKASGWNRFAGLLAQAVLTGFDALKGSLDFIKRILRVSQLGERQFALELIAGGLCHFATGMFQRLLRVLAERAAVFHET